MTFRYSLSSKLCSTDAISTEKTKPKSSSQNAYVLDVQELVVQYPGQTKPAIQNLSFRINRGEIFGLNGENGSGKTTFYKILTGLLRPNSGSAYVNGINVVKNWRKVFSIIRFSFRNCQPNFYFSKAKSCIGFCPQVDALLELLTATECIYHYARIKGIPECDIEDITVSLLNAVGLKLYANRIVKTYR